MLEKVVQLIISIGVILMGVQAFFERGYRSVNWGRYIDYGPFHQVIGIIIMIIGLFFVYNITKSIIRHRRKGRPPRESG
jgi:uncharacterized membrane protein